MGVDVDGDLWIAVFKGWRIDGFSPSGARLSSIPFPCAQVTKPVFGGPNRKSLFVTTAGLGPQDGADQPFAGAMFCVDDVPSSACRRA
jgi:sugar lactone lactonase YvrE